MTTLDYYAVLKSPRTATPSALKKAYHKLAMKWHPDVYKGADRAASEATFKRVNEAYGVLSDPEKRKRYDLYGDDWEHGPPPREAPTASPSAAPGMSAEDLEKIFGRPDFSEFIRTNFGGGKTPFGDGRTEQGPQRGRARRSGRGADIHADLPLGAGAAIRGGKQDFSVVGTADCPDCEDGFDAAGRPCARCEGVGHVRRSTSVTLTIPKDPRPDGVLRLKGLGTSGTAGGAAGDLYVTIRLKDDEAYRLQGADLETDVTIAPWEALQGAKVPVLTPAAAATLTIPAETAAGTRLRLRGMGFHSRTAIGSDPRGDVYAVIRQALPAGLTARQRALILEAGRPAVDQPA